MDNTTAKRGRKTQPRVELDFKECRMCRDTKPVEDFYVNRANVDGRHSYCKSCCRDRNTSRIKAHRGETRMVRSGVIAGVDVNVYPGDVRRFEVAVPGTTKKFPVFVPAKSWPAAIGVLALHYGISVIRLNDDDQDFLARTGGAMSKKWMRSPLAA